MKHQDHENWNQRNVNLWLSNDEKLYTEMIRYLRQFGADEGARRLADVWSHKRTPDGASYTYSSILSAMPMEMLKP